MAVVGDRVPAGLDATHIGFVFIDVMGNIHCYVPLRIINALPCCSERGMVAPALPGGTGAGASIFGNGTQQQTHATRHPAYDLFEAGVMPQRRSGRWVSLLRRSFPAPPSFHLSRTKCGPLPHRRRPGG